MNKALLSAALIAGFGVAAFAPQAAQAADGTININGTVTAGTCKVNGGSPATVTVTLPSVQTSALSTISSVAARTPFTLAITGCAAGITGATTYFEPGVGIDTVTGNLINTGTAANVEVQLLNGAGSTAAVFSPIVLGAGTVAAQNSGQATVAAGSATLNYYAQYFAKTAAVGAGTVVSSAQFTMIYQ
ncbi:MAG TPA: fimbrial protein [Rhodanobacter sp.]|jgi:major type 1 subunit fimbrin (pilin)|nr:fimbrial protein [Rhodanobacter sp.]